MSSVRQHPLAVAALVIASCLPNTGCGYVAYRTLLAIAPDPPGVKPGIRFDELAASDVAIRLRRFDRTGDAVLAIAGAECSQVQEGQVLMAMRSEAHVVLGDTVVETIALGRELGRAVSILDVDGDGECEFLDHGFDSGAASVLSANGSVRWQFGAKSKHRKAYVHLTPAQLDNDLETVEFLGGPPLELHALDSNGHELWSRTLAKPLSMYPVDLDGDGADEILRRSDNPTAVTLDGNHFRSFDFLQGWRFQVEHLGHLDPRITEFEPIEGGTGHLRVMRLNGDLDALLPIGDYEHWRNSLFRFPWEPQGVYAMVQTFRAEDRTAVTLYSEKGRMIYDEALASSSPRAATITWNEGHRALVVATDDEILVFSRDPQERTNSAQTEICK